MSNSLVLRESRQSRFPPNLSAIAQSRRLRWQTRRAMDVQPRIDVLLERQQAPLVEGSLLIRDVIMYEPHSTSAPGVNSTFFVALDDGSEAFHKPFSGINVNAAGLYGQHPDSVPLNECAAWRLASSLGSVVAKIVAACVMRSISGTAGSLSARRTGFPHAPEPFTVAPDQCRAAAFFDALIAQQDRHVGNYRWDPAARLLGLIDHGFAFAIPGSRFNASCFVNWRHDHNDDMLDEWEHSALELLLNSNDLHGLAGVLADDQAVALHDRAQRMRSEGRILNLGEW